MNILQNRFESKFGPPNMETWDLDLSDDMCFVKIIKRFDSIRP